MGHGFWEEKFFFKHGDPMLVSTEPVTGAWSVAPMLRTVPS